MRNARKSLFETCKEALRCGMKPEQLAPILGVSEVSVRRVQELILREAADACFDSDVEEISVYESSQEADEMERDTYLRNRDRKPTLPTNEP